MTFSKFYRIASIFGDKYTTPQELAEYAYDYLEEYNNDVRLGKIGHCTQQVFDRLREIGDDECLELAYEIKNGIARKVSVEDKYCNPAHRGVIYEFIEKDGTSKNKVLVVSGNHRSTDKYVSILMLGDSPSGYDIVPIILDGETRYVHCGMVTYAKRQNIGPQVSIVPSDIMDRIDNQMAKELDLAIDNWNYKELYDDLLDRLTSTYNE